MSTWLIGEPGPERFEIPDDWVAINIEVSPEVKTRLVSWIRLHYERPDICSCRTHAAQRSN